MNHSRCWGKDNGSRSPRATGTRGGSASAAASRRTAVTASARALTVGASNSTFTGRLTPKASRTRDNTRIASSEWPPSSKKLASIPTCSRFSTSAKIPATSSSAGVRGASGDHLAEIQRQSGESPAIHLAVARLRDGLQESINRRHHVLGKAAPSGAAAARPPRPPRAPSPRTPPAPGRRRGPEAPAPPPRAPPRAPAAPPRSRPARCGSRAPSPGGRSGPGSPDGRRADTAPGPPCGRAAARLAARSPEKGSGTKRSAVSSGRSR